MFLFDFKKKKNKNVLANHVAGWNAIKSDIDGYVHRFGHGGRNEIVRCHRRRRHVMWILEKKSLLFAVLRRPKIADVILFFGRLDNVLIPQRCPLKNRQLAFVAH